MFSIVILIYIQYLFFLDFGISNSHRTHRGSSGLTDVDFFPQKLSFAFKPLHISHACRGSPSVNLYTDETIGITKLSIINIEPGISSVAISRGLHRVRPH